MEPITLACVCVSTSAPATSAFGSSNSRTGLVPEVRADAAQQALRPSLLLEEYHRRHLGVEARARQQLHRRPHRLGRARVRCQHGRARLQPSLQPEQRGGVRDACSGKRSRGRGQGLRRFAGNSESLDTLEMEQQTEPTCR